MSQLSTRTQHVAAGAEESSSGALELSAQATLQSELVSQFVLPGGRVARRREGGGRGRKRARGGARPC